MALLYINSFAETWSDISIVGKNPSNEFWANAGFYTYHFKSNVRLNDNNLGLGGEYRYSTTCAIVFGQFHNSDWKTSNYVGWYWRPLAIGQVGLGAELGGIDGYSKVYNGGWFPVVAPVVSYEYKNIGANVIVIPSYKEQLHGGISLQLKVKL